MLACVGVTISSDPVDGRALIRPTSLNDFGSDSPDDRGCPRRWAFGAIDGIEREQTHALTVGTEAHAAVQAWFESATPPDLSTYTGRLAAALIPRLPPGSRTEFPVNVDVGSPFFRFQGTSDGAYGSDVWDAKFYAPGSRKWMKTFATLLHDAQAILYPASVRDPETGGASFTMHYIIKPPASDEYATPKHIPVGVRWDRESLDAAIRELETRAIRMIWYLANARCANEVPHRAAYACEGIGIRCEFAGRCHLHSPDGALTPPWTLNRNRRNEP